VFSGSPRGQTLLVRLGCCVNAVVGVPALWQPRMEPAPAGPTTRLEGFELGWDYRFRLLAVSQIGLTRRASIGVHSARRWAMEIQCV
jgi:hypothetical protein